MSNEFQINTKEKLDSLIKLYQENIDKRAEKDKKRNRVIFIIFSAFAGVLTISFENMGLIGIDFVGWIYLATVLLILVSAVSIWIYSDKYFDTLERKYESIIKDLKELSIIKY